MIDAITDCSEEGGSFLFLEKQEYKLKNIEYIKKYKNISPVAEID